MPMILGGSGTINTSSSLAVAVAGVEDLRIDASGRVGIGTSSPVSPLSLLSTGSGVSINFNSNGLPQSTTRGGLINYWNDGSIYYNDFWNWESNGVFRVGTAGSERMRIDTSGRVTMPNQPMTCRRLTSSPSAVSLINWDTVVYESGISYNSSTRRFTVPIAGRYRVNFSGFKLNTSATVRVLLGVNTDTPSSPVGSNFGHCYASTSSAYVTISFDVILNLAANDYFVYYLTEGSLYTASGDAFNFMTAQLLG